MKHRATKIWCSMFVTHLCLAGIVLLIVWMFMEATK
jgi:hypothetical protein